MKSDGHLYNWRSGHRQLDHARHLLTVTIVRDVRHACTRPLLLLQLQASLLDALLAEQRDEGQIQPSQIAVEGRRPTRQGVLKFTFVVRLLVCLLCSAIMHIMLLMLAAGCYFHRSGIIRVSLLWF